MTDREALYRAIIANPNEDTPRLVYADWLQENDRPEEAEFIRLDCRLEVTSPDHPDYTDWLARLDELRIWLSTFTPGPKLTFPAGLEVASEESWWNASRRGFPRYVEFNGSHHPGLKAMRALAASLEEAFDKLPTRWLVVRYISNEQLAELLRQPIADQLDTLTLQLYAQDEPNDEAARIIANSPHFKNLSGLVLAFDIGNEGAEALGQSENLRSLKWLNLSGLWFATNAIRSFGASGWFRNLSSLSLANLPDGSFAELCRLEPFHHLHRLSVSDQGSFVVRETFATSKAFPTLTSLEFERVNMSGGGAETLAGAKWFRPSRLDLSNCSIGNAGARALSTAPRLSSLRWLGLRGNLLSSMGVAAIARSQNLTQLKHLDLSNNAMGPSALRAIASNPALRDLITLQMSGRRHDSDKLTHEQFQEFLSQLNMPQLRHLSLRGRPVGAKAARLLTNEKFASLTRLDLENCQLSDSVVKALLQGPALQNLIELKLADNKLTDGVEPLTNPRNMPRLGACDVGMNKLGNTLIARLAKRPGVSRV